MSISSTEGRKVTLKHGLNHVIYTDTEKAVPDDVELYFDGMGIGTLTQIREAGVKNGTLGTLNIWSGKPLGTVDTLKDKLYVKVQQGGARKSLRKRKSKKSTKGKSKKNRRKSNRRR